jgi:hypothetical protein
MTDTNEGVETTPEVVEGEGQEAKEDNVELETLREELRKRDETLGSLKRELKDLKKSKEEPDEPPKKGQPDTQELLQKTYLRAAGITNAEEVELALSTSKKWDMPIDALVDDTDFAEKLERHRTSKANADATSNIRGSGGKQQANQTPEYYIAKGTPPTPEQVSDRKVRAKIARAMMAHIKTGKTFYNE